MNKRQAKKYFKKINNTVEEHINGSSSNTKRIKHYTTVVAKRQIKNVEKKVKSEPPWLRKQRSRKPQIKGLDAYKGRKTYFSGPFDTFGELTGYLRAAQSSGNRIEQMHPGFFDTYSKLGRKLLDFIWDLYASYHRASFLYDANEDYVDEEKYEFLIDVLDEQLTYLGE